MSKLNFPYVAIENRFARRRKSKPHSSKGKKNLIFMEENFSHFLMPPALVNILAEFKHTHTHTNFRAAEESFLGFLVAEERNVKHMPIFFQSTEERRKVFIAIPPFLMNIAESWVNIVLKA